MDASTAGTDYRHIRQERQAQCYEPMKQREQKPNSFGLCRVATEEDDSQYGIQSVPTLMLFRQGDVLWRTSGIVQKSELLATIKSLSKNNL